MEVWKTATRYIRHRFSAARKPRGEFLREFAAHILKDDRNNPAFRKNEAFRTRLLTNYTEVTDEDPGAGSRHPRKTKTIADVTRVASVSPRNGRLLARMVLHYHPSQVVELGTAAGISTVYLARPGTDVSVVTIEGNPGLAAAAEVHFREMGLSQIQVINQTFDEALPVLIKDLQPGALIFIDGNHTREATLRYFNTFSQVPGIRPIIILDDVNWSEEMQEGWKTIYSGIREGLCIDLFHMGIYFSEPSQIPHFIRMNY